MSAFSDWNGPGCGGGPSLPQVRTLEELILRVGELQGAVNQLQAVTSPYIGTKEIQNAIAAALATAQGGISGVSSSLQQTQNKLGNGNLPTGQTDLVSWTSSIAAILTSVQNGLTPVAQWLGTKPTGTTYSTLTGWVQALENIVNNPASGIAATVAALKNALGPLWNTSGGVSTQITQINDAVIAVNKLLKDPYLLLDRPMFKFFTDFTSFVNVGPTDVAVNRNAGPLNPMEFIGTDQPTLAEGVAMQEEILKSWEKDAPEAAQYFSHTELLGHVSVKWDETQRDGVQVKTARAHVLYGNSLNLSAICDIVCTRTTQGTTVKNTAALFVTCSKLFLNKVRFGVYWGTNQTIPNQNNQTRMYLGMKIKGSASGAVNNSYMVAGENFIPANASNGPYYAPYGGVHKLCEVDCYAQNGGGVAGVFEANTIIAETIHSDSVVTNSIITLDENGNPINLITINNNQIIIGDPNHPRDLIFNTKDRPTIVHEDGSSHKVGYIGDAAMSVYWQRGVTVIEDTLALLNSLKVYVNADGDIVPPTTQGATQVPGFYYYLSDTDVDGVKFDATSTALVRFSDTTETGVADGYINADISTFTAGQWVSENLLTHMQKQMILTNGGSYDIMQPATIVEDAGGRFARLIDVRNAGGGLVEYEVQPIAGTDVAAFYQYVLPRYAKFDGTTWAFDGPAIKVPRTFDGHIDDITYQWSGAAKSSRNIGQTHFEHADGYVLWYAHEDNEKTMTYDGDGWNFLSLMQIVTRPIPMPVGAIATWAWALNNVPVGWLKTDGTTVNIADYPELYAIIGDNFQDTRIPAPPAGQFRLPVQDNGIIRWNPLA